jgi:acetyltransferase
MNVKLIVGTILAGLAVIFIIQNTTVTDLMGQYNLECIFKPRHVAVVGASEKAGTIGNALIRNLIEGGFAGKVLPVNPNYKTIHGLECFGSLAVLRTGVDLAIIATPIHGVADIVSQCVEKKVGGAVIISAGGKEVGEKAGRSKSGSGALLMPAGFVSWGRTAWALFGPG